MSAPAPTQTSQQLAAATSSAPLHFSNTTGGTQADCPMKALLPTPFECAFEFLRGNSMYQLKDSQKLKGLVPGKIVGREDFPEWDHEEQALFMSHCDGKVMHNKKSSAELKAHLLENSTVPMHPAVAYMDLLKSPILKSRLHELGITEKFPQPLDAIKALSEKNLSLMKEKSKALQIERDDDIDNAVRQIHVLYKNANYTHATKHGKLGQLHTTNGIAEINDIANKFGTGKDTVAQSSTKEANSAQFFSHNFVFFNVYPSFEKTEARNSELKKCRFLREDYTKSESSFADDAFTFVFEAKDPRFENALIVLRDPVCPVGTSAVDARLRVKPPFNYVEGNEPGQFKYTLSGGEVLTYDTSEHIFFGKDILEGLVLNVWFGLYQMKKALPSAAAGTGGASMATSSSSQSAPDATADMSTWDGVSKVLKSGDLRNVIKLFQYPQLLHPGSLTTERAEAVPATKRK